MLDLLTQPLTMLVLLAVLVVLLVWWLGFMKREQPRAWRDYVDFRLLMLLIFGGVVLVARACGAEL
jgi:hypothetical protein